MFCILGGSVRSVNAATDTTSATSQVNDLNSKIQKSQDHVNELDDLISKYKAKISQQESQQTSLENEVSILDNRIAEKQLDIQRAQAALETTQLEIESLQAQIEDQDQRIAAQKTQAAEMIRTIARSDDVPMVEVLLSSKSLSDFFDQIEADKQVQRDLTEALDKVKTLKQTLQDDKDQMDQKKKDIEDNKQQISKDQLQLEAERNFKASLADETKNQQSGFEQVLYELQQQQQSTADDISQLKDALKDKLNTADTSLASGDAVLNWPVDPTRGITAKFHDPTYPFNYLFPHPGEDIRASVGTPVKAAAGGYVAWTKLGRMYGNYMMIVHPGNIATVYAHLSKFIAKPDTYVSRGDTIGLSGGMPGQPGAGLSTGPHLHFEVRLNGIPVNPENYLPAIPSN